MPPNDIGLRLRWTATGLGGENDFTGRDPARPRVYCRMYRVEGGPQDQRWYWTAADERELGTGHASSARKAALAAERALLGSS